MYVQFYYLRSTQHNLYVGRKYAHVLYMKKYLKRQNWNDDGNTVNFIGLGI